MLKLVQAWKMKSDGDGVHQELRPVEPALMTPDVKRGTAASGLLV